MIPTRGTAHPIIINQECLPIFTNCLHSTRPLARVLKLSSHRTGGCLAYQLTSPFCETSSSSYPRAPVESQGCRLIPFGVCFEL